MRKMFARSGPLMVLASALVLIIAPAAFAHEHRGVGDHEVEVGWLEEPAVAGFANAVQFAASHTDGEPVTGATLQVEVFFGDRNSDQKSDLLTLEPAFGTPGEYHAFLIPTRPGTYTFHVTGQLGEGEDVDEFFTSGPETFAEVQDPQEAQFPAKDPTSGQLSEKIDRLDGRLATVQEAATSAAKSAEEAATSATKSAEDAVGTARLLAIVGIALGAVALGTSVVLSMGARRTRPAAR